MIRAAISGLLLGLFVVLGVEGVVVAERDAAAGVEGRP